MIDPKVKEHMMRFPCQIVDPKKEDSFYEISFGATIGQGTPIDWLQYVPVYEGQGGNSGCVSFSRLNCAETLARKEGIELNLSDRHLFVLSGTTKTGNDLNKVAETFRKAGIVKEDVFPWTSQMLQNPNTYWQQIFDTSSIPQDAPRYFGGNHSWVNPQNKVAMLDALSKTPIQIAVGVGDNWGDGVIRDTKKYFTYHAIEFLKYDEQNNYVILDTYPPFIKILDKNYNILQAKSFADLPENWKESRNLTLVAIQEVFGANWKPAKIFYDRGLVARGIYGAVRVVDSSVIPPYKVFTIGGGGNYIKDMREFYRLFGTYDQRGIVGNITTQQAQKLGININLNPSGLPIIESASAAFFEQIKNWF